MRGHGVREQREPPRSDEVYTGVVERVEAYDLYATTSAGPVLVLIPDVSIQPVDLEEQYRPGDTIAVKIIRYVERYRLYEATMVW